MLFNEIATTREIRYIEINLTSSDNTYAPEGPVFVDIPSSYIQTLGCDWSQMRLEDQDGNPITFWPDANGASEVYPGYYSIWFKTDIPATESKTFRLYCDPRNPTYTSNPTDVVDFYCDCSDLSVFGDYGPHTTLDNQKYVDPPASVNVYPKDQADTSTDGWIDFIYDFPSKYLIKFNFSFIDQGRGYFIYMWYLSNGSPVGYGPRVWYGGSSVSNFGTNYGYRTSTSIVTLGQYDADGQWHRILVVADNSTSTFDLFYDGSLVRQSLPFYGQSPSASGVSGARDYFYAYSYSVGPNLSDPHVDSYIITSVQYRHAPNVSVSAYSTRDTSCVSRPLSLL